MANKWVSESELGLDGNMRRTENADEMLALAKMLRGWQAGIKTAAVNSCREAAEALVRASAVCKRA